MHFRDIAFLRRTHFILSIHGPLWVFLLMMLPFALTMLGLGLWITSRVNSSDAARQISLGTVLSVDIPIRVSFPDRFDAQDLSANLPSGPDDLDDRCVRRSDPNEECVGTNSGRMLSSRGT